MDVTENDFSDEGVDAPPPAAMEDLPEEDAPEDIEQDAMEELDRLHAQLGQDDGRFQQQQSFDPTYGMGAGMSSGFAQVPSFQPVVERTPRHEEQDFPSVREHKTLEDLYASWPNIGNGEFYIRVERKHPASYQGQRVAGFLEDLHHQISMREFSEKFGGHTYEVSVRGPGKSGGDGSDRTLKTIRLQVPGPPKLLARADENGYGDPRRMRQSQQDQAIELRRMELEHQARREAQQREDAIRRQQEERQRREQQSQQPILNSTIDELRKMHREQSAVTTSVHQQTIQNLSREIENARGIIERKDQHIQQLRDELLQVKADASNRWKEEESRQIRDLKERHASDLQRIAEEHAATVARIEQESGRRIQSLTEGHQRELAQLRDAEARERERLRDDANRREQALQDEANRREQAHRDREQMIRDEYNRREEASRRELESRLQMMERQNKRDLEMIRSTESSKAVFTEQTASNQMSFLNMQLKEAQKSEAAAQAEAAALREELMRHTNKPLLQQVEETKTIGEALGLFESKPEKKDWKESLVDGVSSALQKAPEMMEAVIGARQQNQQAVAAARAAQAQRAAAVRRQQQQQLLAAPPPMAPAVMGPAVAQRTQQPVPPPSWDQGPSDPSQGPPVPFKFQGPPMPEPAPLAPDVAPPNAPTPPPVYDDTPMPVSTGPSFVMGPEIRKTPEELAREQASSPAAPQPAPQPPVQAAPEPPPMEAAQDPFAAPEEPAEDPHDAMPESAGGQGFQMDQESILRFVEQLDLAIGVGFVGPDKFAEKFVEEAGPETTAQLLQQITPEGLIELVSEHAGDRLPNIQSRSGRKYITALWQEAGKLVVISQ